jgi:uracil-DNA glycosylase family 4
MRQELAALEADLQLCERCWGPERRTALRYERPPGRPSLLALLERPPRGGLAREERLGLGGGDEAIGFLAAMLAEAGVPEREVLLGACVMCRPQARRLEAAVPVGVCLRECAGHVRELVRLVAPRLVVALGRVALRSLREAFPDEPEVAALRFPESVGRAVRLGPARVVPLYHVTARARLTRPEAAQRKDWRAVGELWREVAVTAG